jgi:outer membrane protein, adhesin transport system
MHLLYETSGFATSKLVDYQKNRILSASYHYIEKANDTAFQMVNMYIQLLRQKELVAVVKENLKINTEIYSKVKSLFESGLTTLSEVEKINSSVALAQSNVVVKENNLMDAQYNFQRILGRYPDINELSVPTLDVALPEKLKEATEYAILNNPSMLVNSYNIEGEKVLLKQKRSLLYPSIDFQVTKEYNKSYSEEIADTKDDKFNAMLMLRYNLYNGGANRAEIKKQVSVISQRKDIIADTKRQIIQGMELSWSAYIMLEKQLGHLYNYRDYSKKTLGLYKEEYDFGKRSLLDLLAAQNDFDSAQQEIITAKYNHMLAKYRILDAMGSMVSGILGNQSNYKQKVDLGLNSERRNSRLTTKLFIAVRDSSDYVINMFRSIPYLKTDS